MSFLDLVTSTVRENKHKVFATWYDDKGKPTTSYTFLQLWEEAEVIAYYLRDEWDLKKGDRVILCYNFGLQFFAAFLGCLKAGITAVLVYPPSPGNLVKSLPKMNKVANDCIAKVILLDSYVNALKKFDQSNPFSKSKSLWPQNVEYKVHPPSTSSTRNAKKKESNWFSWNPNKTTSTESTDEIRFENSRSNHGKDEETSTGNPDDLAFLQYTSGSTGEPKGVCVTYGALHANVNLLLGGFHQAFQEAEVPVENIVGFSWLPQYHDMGLIYAIITPFVGGWNCNMISPLTFIKNPVLWIELMSKLKVNWSVAPDFAFRLAARKFNEMKQRTIASGNTGPPKQLDLSAIVYLQSSAEPIQPETKALFEEAFRNCNLRKNWYYPAYGLAEYVVGCTFLNEYKLSSLQPTKGRSLVAVGHTRTFHKSLLLKIVNPITFKEAMNGDVGELWISGPSVAAGYYGKDELTTEIFGLKIKGDESDHKSAAFLRTGDQAFIENDYLYICGRIKDLIILNGVNYHPQDIESTVENASSFVRGGCVAAFSSDDIGSGGDGDLEIVFEIRVVPNQTDIVNAIEAIRRKVLDEIGLAPCRIVAIKERSILKTTSGKIQRKANRDALHNGRLQIVYDYVVNSLQNEIDLRKSENEEQLYPINKSNLDPFDTIMNSFFGNGYISSVRWDELGMSSMTSVQIRDAISESFALVLDPDCFEQYLTPDALKEYVLRHQGTPLAIELSNLEYIKSTKLPWWLLGFLQFFGSIALLFIFASAIVPAWFAGKHALASMQKIDAQDINLICLLVPFVVPCWMLAFTLIVILLKWLVVGKYKEGIVTMCSVAYLQWWFVDRAVTLWENWVGVYVKDTPLINFVYILLGANIHHYVSIDTYIREFDLVNIGERSTIEYPLRCHKFGIWDDKSGPFMRFRSITVKHNCVIKGMVSPGGRVGEHTTVEKLSMMPEGAQALPCSCIVGNPAFAIKSTASVPGNNENWLVFGTFKILWLIFELYLFFAIMILAQNIWIPSLKIIDWRYADVLEWFLLILWFSLVSIVISIVLKWFIIGKRRPGPYNNSTWRKIADWICDWHYHHVATGLLLSLTSKSLIWNTILLLHGMDLDYKSRVNPGCFPPSIVDLAKVKESFVARSSFSLKKGKEGTTSYHQISISGSSIGYRSHLGPGDIHISDVIIPPYSHVANCINNPDTIKDEKKGPASLCSYNMIGHMFVNIGYLVLLGLYFSTLLPSYELWTNVFNPASVWMIVPTFVCALALQTLVWTGVLAFLQFVALFRSGENDKSKPWSKIVYVLYSSDVFAHQTYSMVSILHGSPAYNLILKFLGSKIEGQAVLFPDRFYEYPLLKFADKTIVDSAFIDGHYVVYDEVTIGPCKATGTINSGTYIANALITLKESGPLRAYVGTYTRDEIQTESSRQLFSTGHAK